MNFFFQKNQEELFKPFLISAFQKIKEDLEDEFTTEIENKDSELQLLKSQNSDLTQKLKDAEKKEVKAQKGNAKETEIKSNESTLQEPNVEYSPAKETDNNQLIDLKEKELPISLKKWEISGVTKEITKRRYVPELNTHTVNFLKFYKRIK